MAGEIIGRLQDILLPVATDGRVLEANPATLASSGYSAAEMTSLHLHDLDAPQRQPYVDAHLREAAERGGVHCLDLVDVGGVRRVVDLQGCATGVQDRHVTPRRRVDRKLLERQHVSIEVQAPPRGRSR